LKSNKKLWYLGIFIFLVFIIPGIWKFIPITIQFITNYYSTPYAASEDVSITIRDSIRLEGTLTKPLTKANKVPVVILVSPPSIESRDALSRKKVKRFLVFADSLSKHGIAVLRFDNRGMGKSSKWNKPVTLYTHADDVIAWINYLKTREDINSNKIGLLGISEGGCTCQVVASQPGKVSFLVLLASLGIGGWESYVYQLNSYWKFMGIQRNFNYQDSLNAAIQYQKPVYDVLNRYESAADDTIVKYVVPLIFKWIYNKYGNNLSEDACNIIAKYIDTSVNKVIYNKNGNKLSKTEFSALFKNALIPWLNPQQRALKTFKPEKYLSKIKCPVLALNGTLDDAVDCYPNLKKIEETLKDNGNKNVTTVPIKNVGHSFLTMGIEEQTYHITKEGGHGTISMKDSVPYYAIPNEKFSQMALDIIIAWIRRQ